MCFNKYIHLHKMRHLCVIHKSEYDVFHSIGKLTHFNNSFNILKLQNILREQNLQMLYQLL